MPRDEPLTEVASEKNYSRFIFPLESSTVVDKRALTTVPSEELGTFLSGIYAEGKTVTFVESPKRAFSVSKLMTMIEQGDTDDIQIVLEFNKISLGDEEFALIKNFKNLKEKIVETIEANKVVVPYPFAEVPASWSLSQNLSIKTNTIRRATNGEAEGYTIGMKAAQSLWDHAKEFWAANGKKYIGEKYVRAGGESHYARVGLSQIAVGCQNIRRYELEQLALELNWAFPIIEVEDA